MVPSEWPQVAASGRKWPLQTVPSEWLQVAAVSGRKWPQVAAGASGRKFRKGHKRLLQTVPSE